MEKYVGTHAWKYGEGANIGDCIDFRTGFYTIRKNTIFRNDSTVAIVSYFKEAKPRDDAEMKIKLFKDSSTGFISPNSATEKMTEQC